MNNNNFDATGRMVEQGQGDRRDGQVWFVATARTAWSLPSPCPR